MQFLTVYFNKPSELTYLIVFVVKYVMEIIAYSTIFNVLLLILNRYFQSQEKKGHTIVN